MYSTNAVEASLEVAWHWLFAATLGVAGQCEHQPQARRSEGQTKLREGKGDNEVPKLGGVGIVQAVLDCAALRLAA